MSSPEAAPLLIFPFNGNGLEALDCLGESWRCVGFIDDEPEKQTRGAFGHPVLSRTALAEKAEAKVLAVPGSPTSYRARKHLIEGLRVAPDRFAQVIHPSACISPRAVLGHNLLIMAGVVVTANAFIGNHVCILPNTVIHHDAVIGDWTLIGSNVTVAGGCAVGRNCYIGSGSSLIHGIRVDDGALVGLGSNVIRHVGTCACVAGNPAKPLRRDSSTHSST